MVKLASARESRTYGPRLTRNRWEYINAGLHVFACVLLAAGFASQLPYSGSDADSGLGRATLIAEDDRRRIREGTAGAAAAPPIATPYNYKDVLLGSQAGSVLL